MNQSELSYETLFNLTKFVLKLLRLFSLRKMH